MSNLLVLALALFAVAQALPQAPSLYFTWEDCGEDSARPLKIHYISVSPDPILLPGTALISFDVESTAEMSNLDLKLKIRKKMIIGSFPVPCINNLGSCTYTDLCQYAPGTSICPIPPTRLAMNEIKLPLPDPGSLGSLLKGSYTIKAYFSETDTGREMGCFEIGLKLKT